MKKRLLPAAVFFLLFFIESKAQKVVSTTEESNYSVWNVLNNFNEVDDSYTWGQFTRTKSILYLDNASAAMPITLPGGFAMIKIDRTGKKLWQQMVNGFIISVCKINGKVVALYSHEWGGTKDPTANVIQRIHAVSFDAATGEKIADKPVFENKKGFYIEPKINTLPDGELSNLLIRYTAVPKKYNDSKSTASFDLIQISSDLSANAHPLNSMAINNVFLGCTCTSPDDLYIFSKRIGGQLTVETFDTKSQTLINKSSIDVDVKDDYHYQCEGYYGAEQPDKIYFVLRHFNNHKKMLFKLFSIDTKTKKIATQEDVMDKEYAEMLKTQNPSANTKKADVEDALKLPCLYANKDYVFEVKQVNKTGATNYHISRDFNFEIIVSIFDRDLKNKNNVVINRELSVVYIGGTSVSCHAIGDKLMVFYNVNGAGIGRVLPQLIVIDLKTLKQDNTISNEKNILGDHAIEADGILWFADGPLLPCFSHLESHTFFEKVSL